MLIQCPECKQTISDQAESCPHCGYPMKKKRSTTSKHMRLPNGFGQISEIKNRKLRKPFRAMVTVGISDTGRPICKPLKPHAYFETYNDAYKALVEYNSSPYDLSSTTTVSELYEKWSEKYYPTVSEGCAKNYRSCWKYCSELYDMRVSEVRSRHIRHCIEEGVVTEPNRNIKHPTPVVSNKTKTLLNMMFDYAVEYEMAERNYARDVKIPEVRKALRNVQQAHIVFDDDEMVRILSMSSVNECAAMLLTQCYAGWRPAEVAQLRIENINLNKQTFTGGSKTEAGTNRTVPIHPRLKYIVERYYRDAVEHGREYLFTLNDYKDYMHEFWNLKTALKLKDEHRLHDGRKHFITLAKRSGVNDHAIKRIVGHQISDITESIYTERDPDWLRHEIEKIK